MRRIVVISEFIMTNFKQHHALSQVKNSKKYEKIAKLRCPSVRVIAPQQVAIIYHNRASLWRALADTSTRPVATAAWLEEPATSRAASSTVSVAVAAYSVEGAACFVAKAADGVAEAARRVERPTESADTATSPVAASAGAKMQVFSVWQKNSLNDWTTKASNVVSTSVITSMSKPISQHRAFGANQTVRSKAGSVAHWQPNKKGGEGPC